MGKDDITRDPRIRRQFLGFFTCFQLSLFASSHDLHIQTNVRQTQRYSKLKTGGLRQVQRKADVKPFVSKLSVIEKIES